MGSADSLWLSHPSACMRGSKPRCVQAKREISELTWPHSRRWRSPICDSPRPLPAPAGLPFIRVLATDSEAAAWLMQSLPHGIANRELCVLSLG